MSIWAIPYVDHDLDFWQEIAARFGAHVREVYFPMPVGDPPPGGTVRVGVGKLTEAHPYGLAGTRFVASGRGRQPERFMERFLRHAPLPKAVLANPIVLSRPVEEAGPPIVEALRRLYGEFGVRSAIVTNLALARRIREALPEFTITASTLMGVATPAQALVAGDFVHAITADTRLTRDLRGLRRLRQAFGGEIRLIVNEACLPGCLYRTQHFYEMGYGDWFPQSLCQQTLAERPWLRLTGAWILPRHLSLYDGLYDSLKLAGRVTLRDRARYMAVLDAYVHRQPILPRDIGGGPASPLTAIDMPDDLFKWILNCEKDCHVCSVCRDYYEQAVVGKGEN